MSIINYQMGIGGPGPISGPGPIPDYPYEAVPVLNTIQLATYDNGDVFPFVRINYPFVLQVLGTEYELLSRNGSAVVPYNAYSVDLDLNMWVLYLGGPYGFCSWKQLAWHNANSLVLGLARTGDYSQVDQKGNTVVDWSLSPVGDIELPVYGFVKLFDEKQIEPIHIGDLVTKFSFGNDIWKVPDRDIMSAIGAKDSIPLSFANVKSILAVPAFGAKTLNAKVLSQVLEFRGNPEQVMRTKEELRRMTYGNGSIGSLWVGEKIFPGRFNSMKSYTRERDYLRTIPASTWAVSDKFFGEKVVFWRRPILEQLRTELYTEVENSQGVLMNTAGVQIGDSFNRWPLVTRVDSSVFDITRHTTVKSKTGELATSPFGNAVKDQTIMAVGTPTLIYTPIGDHEEGIFAVAQKLSYQGGELELKYHAQLQANKEPWYSTYEDFQNDIRPLSKGFSVIPEFRASQYVEDGIDTKSKNEIELVGSSESTSSFVWDSLNDNFSDKQLLTSELITINKFSAEVGKSAKKRSVRFDFEAIKKFHPYVGFFPAERSTQIGNLLYKSYYDGVYGVAAGAVAQNSMHWQAFLYHLMAPGVFYNSIKSAIGVGLPIFSSSSRTLSTPVYGTHNDGTFIPKCIKSNPKFNLPFEALFNLPKHIIPVSNNSLSALTKEWGRLMFAPYVWELYPGDTDFLHDLNCYLVNGKFKPLFDLANHNFFAESANLFLKDGLSAFFSKPESQFKAMVGGSVYYMDVVLRNKNCVICEGASKEVLNVDANYSTIYAPAGVPGLNDAIFSSVLSGENSRVAIRVEVGGGTSPNTYTYSLDGTVWSSPVNMTIGVQGIGATGAAVRFGSLTGHTVNDVWYYSAPGSLNLSQKGSAFGFPVSLSSTLADETTTDIQKLQRDLDIRDPAYGPFTPPYFYAPAVARISFDPQEADPSLATGQSKKFSLDEILKHAEIRTYAKTLTGGQIENLAFYAYPGADSELNAMNGLYHEFDWKTALYGHTNDVYDPAEPVTTILGSTILQTGFMNIAQSVDLFNKRLVSQTSFDGRKNVPAFTAANKNLGSSKEYVWCINTKWESPVLQFNKHSTASYDNMGTSAVVWPERARGMWMDYGEEPAAEDGLFLEIRESFPERKIQNRNIKNFFNIIDPNNVKGGTYSAMSVPMLEEVADLYDEVGSSYISKKKIESLIDVCGFGVGEKKLGVVKDETEIQEAIVVLPFHRVDGEVKFFEIDRDMLALQIANKQNHGYAYKTAYDDELKDTSITQLVSKIDKFVLPPWLDFMKNDVIPLSMYICEFGISLEKSDLLDIWQNFAPDKFYGVEVEKKSIEHGWDTYELLHGQELPEDTQFAVFKVKQKAEWNYDAIKPNHSKDEEFVFDILNAKGVWESKRVDYNFNWPYDFCSLVEFGKVSCSFEFVGE